MAGGLLLVQGTVFGQTAPSDEPPDGPPDMASQLKALQEEMRGLRRENDAMKGEIDELRAVTSDQWLTERRAEEIRGIVQDVLADADTRASLLNDGLIAGWSDGFFLSSPDGRFRLTIGGQMQARWVFNYHDQTDHYIQGFENTRTKLIFGGHIINPDWEFRAQTNFDRDGGEALLEDAWIRHHLNNDVSIRFGQFKLPFTREFLVDSSRQLAVERSLIDGAMNLGRSQGIEMTFSSSTARFIAAFSDGAEDNMGQESGFNLAGTQPDPANTSALTRDTEYAGTARYEVLVAGHWGQFDDLTSPQSDEFGMLIGAAIHTQEQEGGLPGPRESRWFGWTADLSVEFGGANVFASFTQHYLDEDGVDLFANIYGIVVQAGVYITPKWEVFGRMEYGWTNFDLANGTFERSDLLIFTFGANHYLDGHDLKWSSDIGFGASQVEDFWINSRAGYRTDAEDAEPQIVIRTQIQLLF
jgi:hypothetical protein